jgi:flagellar basal-body rod modification protein FlgD
VPTPIGGIASAAPASPTASTSDSMMSALSGLGSDGFLKLLVAQLRYQNPLEPTDASEMMGQTAQLAQLDTVQQLVALQRQELGLQQATVAAGLVGTTVTAATAGGGSVTGTVDAVRYTEAGPVLELGGTEVLLGSVVEVRRPTGGDAAGFATSAPGTTTSAAATGTATTPSGLTTSVPGTSTVPDATSSGTTASGATTPVTDPATA